MFRQTGSIACIFLLGLGAGCTSGPVKLYGNQPSPDTAIALITLPEALEVATINGAEIEGASGMLSKGDKTLEVAPGRYEILVYYRELWDRGDQHDVLRSDPALFVIDAGPGHRYRIDYTKPGNLSQARALTEDFRGWVENVDTGERVASQASGLEFRKGLVPAVTFDDTLVRSAGDSGGVQMVQPLPPAATTIGAAGPAAQVVAPAIPPGAMPASASPQASGAAPPEKDWLALMKGWWNQASPEERREFLRWLGE